MRRRIGWWLRCLADCVDYEHSPRRMGQWGFRIIPGLGLKWCDDGTGCPVWYFNQDYPKAHDDA